MAVPPCETKDGCINERPGHACCIRNVSCGRGAPSESCPCPTCRKWRP